MKKVLVIDNYDSFTFNLVHYLEELECEVVVCRNDKLTLEEVADFQLIVLSPGPGIPDEAGLLKTIIKTYASSKKIFGVCLGQQAIAEVFGGKLIDLDRVYHGVATEIEQVESDYIFKDLPARLAVGRYHSWIVDPNLPSCLEATALDESGGIMALRHRTYNVRSVQFHPESVLTPHGKKILENWLNEEA